MRLEPRPSGYLRIGARLILPAMILASLLSGCVGGSGDGNGEEPSLPVTHGTYIIIIGTSNQMLEVCPQIDITYSSDYSSAAVKKVLTEADFTDSVPTSLSIGIDSMVRAATVKIDVPALPDTIRYSLSIPGYVVPDDAAAPLDVPIGIRAWMEGENGLATYIFAISQRVLYIPELNSNQLDDYIRQFNTSFTFTVPIAAQ